MKTFATALLAVLVASENVLPDLLSENPRRGLTTEGPQADVTDEAGCTTLNNETRTNSWYDYVWVEDGCYCSINWKKSYIPDKCALNGEVVNPFYKPSSGVDSCITLADFNNNVAFSSCPDPTCADILGDSRGFASAYLQPSGSAADFGNASQMETGVVHFQEMCAGDEVDTCGGEACEGTCVTGVFFGIPLISADPDRPRGFSIHTYATPQPGLPMGCEAGGDIFDPVGITDRYSIEDFENDDTVELMAGVLKDVSDGTGTSEGGQCLKNTYSYCKPAGEI